MRILVIYTGGTIGMVKASNTEALKPGSVHGIEDFIYNENLIKYCDIKSMSTLIDSSNFNKEYYTELSSLIKESYQKYDAFLILMGTDTMAYISSLLSFCISGLSKPILFTGGQKTLYEANSDSVYNLKESIIGLIKGRFANEVGVFFAGKWHRAVCVTKQYSKSFDAYVSVHHHSFFPNLNERFEIVTKLSSNIAVLRMTPFDDEYSLKAILKEKELNGLVLEIYGSGNIPNLSTNLKELFIKKINEGMKVVVSSQCMYEGLDIDRYDSSVINLLPDVLEAGSMTKESVVSKLMFLIEKKLNSKDFRRMFNDSLRGEL